MFQLPKLPWSAAKAFDLKTHSATLLLVMAISGAVAGCGGGSSDSAAAAGDTAPSGGSGNGAGGGSNNDNPPPDKTEVFKDIGLSINELMVSIYMSDSADNKSDFNWRQPWLEIHNATADAIDLSGYSLTSKGIENKSWTFPDISIAGGEYLRIWGTGFDRRTDRNDLHTSFPIMGADALSIVGDDNSILDRVENVSFPSDQSWARYPDGADTYAFSNTPTPGRANAPGGDRFSINCDDMTLTADRSFQLKTSPEVAVTWSSNNPAVAVSASGVISSTVDGTAGRFRPILVTATDDQGFSRDCQVTVVDWVANESELIVMGNPRADFLLDYFDDGIYYTLPRELYRAEDGFVNDVKVGTYPYANGQPLMLKTPYGYFANAGQDIFTTQDFNTWTPELKMQHSPLQHGFSNYYDQSSAINYVYAGEYSVKELEPHAVYRGVNTGANTSWQKVLNWDSERSFRNDNSRLNTIRHVHVTTTDPYTGHVWVATGDLDQHCRLYFSDDHGATFSLVAMGSQKFRSLSVWFTEKYVYWNMDSERADQHVYRIARSVYAQNGNWPSLTPELSSGTTKAGIRYLVSATNGSTFPVSTGNFFVESGARQLSANERVYAIEDPQYDYSEAVANLTHASQWYHLWVKDQNDEDVLIMATSAEGTEPMLRDYNSRVFGFKERADGSVDVQELLDVRSRTPRRPNPFTQLVPNMQDKQGYIYLRGRDTAHRIYKTKLHWVDQD